MIKNKTYIIIAIILATTFGTRALGALTLSSNTLTSDSVLNSVSTGNFNFTTTIANGDIMRIAPATGGGAAFTGILTSADLSAGRTWTFPNVSGTVITTGDTASVPETLLSFSDNTTGNATTSQHGLLPKLGGGTTNFLRADGTWAAAGGGGSVAASSITPGTFGAGTYVFTGLEGSDANRVQFNATYFPVGSGASGAAGEFIRFRVEGNDDTNWAGMCIVTEGGSRIVIKPCWGGTGSQNMAFQMQSGNRTVWAGHTTAASGMPTYIEQHSDIAFNVDTQNGLAFDFVKSGNSVVQNHTYSAGANGVADPFRVRLNPSSADGWEVCDVITTGECADGDTYLRFNSLARSVVFPGRPIQFADWGTKPTCNASTHGTWWLDSAGGANDTLEMCMKDSGDVYGWEVVKTAS